jgi:hypothetical protein
MLQYITWNNILKNIEYKSVDMVTQHKKQTYVLNFS